MDELKLNQRLVKEFAKLVGIIKTDRYESIHKLYDAAIDELLNAVTLVPLEDWHEEIGSVIWWKLPVDEPPWVGTPLDSDWPDYHTHFTRLLMPLGYSNETCP